VRSIRWDSPGRGARCDLRPPRRTAATTGGRCAHAVTAGPCRRWVLGGQPPIRRRGQLLEMAAVEVSPHSPPPALPTGCGPAGGNGFGEGVLPTSDKVKHDAAMYG